MSAPLYNAETVRAPISLHPNPCYVGWGGTCDPWACLCKKDGGHEGRHVCICGSWKPAQFDGTGVGQ
jgi:hypothetical protein